MSSSTSSRSTLTITPSTMSPSLKYLMVWSIAARKSSAEPMSLTAIWGVLSGRTWVEVMWLVAPDGFDVGTQSTRGRSTAGLAGRAGEGRSLVPGTALTDLWRIPMVRTSGGVGPPGYWAGTGGRDVSPSACHEPAAPVV